MSITVQDAVRWFFGFSQKIRPENLVPTEGLTMTVIVPAYNEEKSIAATIKSIKASTYPVDEIIVVDDCSSDRTSEIALALGVTVVRTSVNQGTKAQSQMYVLGRVTTDLCLTLDGDTTIAPDAIARTIPYFANKMTAAVCGMIVPQQIDSLWTRGRFIEYLFGLSVLKPAQNHNSTIFVSSGCFTVFRMDILNKLGGFESRTMAEDMDYTWSAIGAGYRVYYEPRAVSYPVEPDTLKIYWNQVNRWSRSLLQNISVRGGRFESTRLGVLIYWYLFWSLVGPFLIPIIFWHLSGSIASAVVFTLLAQSVLIWLPAYARAVYMWMKGERFGFEKKELSFWSLTGEVLICCSCFLVTQYVNSAAFLYAVYKEWVRRDKLTVWHKGHA